MDFHAEPDFLHRDLEPRFFVRSLDESEAAFLGGNRWQIQFLNENGQGAANLDFGPDDPSAHFSLLAMEVPTAVIEAARSGLSGYIDSDGNRCDPIRLEPL